MFPKSEAGDAEEAFPRNIPEAEKKFKKETNGSKLHQSQNVVFLS